MEKAGRDNPAFTLSTRRWPADRWGDPPLRIQSTFPTMFGPRSIPRRPMIRVAITPGELHSLIRVIERDAAEAVERLITALPPTVKDWKNARDTAAWAVSKGRESPIPLADREMGAPR